MGITEIQLLKPDSMDRCVASVSHKLICAPAISAIFYKDQFALCFPHIYPRSNPEIRNEVRLVFLTTGPDVLLADSSLAVPRPDLKDD